MKGSTPDLCEARGCCWSPSSTRGVPYCYFPSNYAGYRATNVTRTQNWLTADVIRTTKSAYPDDVMFLKLSVTFRSKERIHIKVLIPVYYVIYYLMLKVCFATSHHDQIFWEENFPINKVLARCTADFRSISLTGPMFQPVLHNWCNKGCGMCSVLSV